MRYGKANIAASLAIALSLFAGTPAGAAELTVTLTDPAWNGFQIPAGQQCAKFGGKGAAPATRIGNIPAGTNAIVVEFNDRDYQPLSNDGGHGKIGFWIKQGAKSADLPAVSGETDKMPKGAFLEARNRATGSYATGGYLPPCSGGRGHVYFADIKAVRKTEGERPKVLVETRFLLGQY